MKKIKYWHLGVLGLVTALLNTIICVFHAIDGCVGISIAYGVISLLCVWELV